MNHQGAAKAQRQHSGGAGGYGLDGSEFKEKFQALVTGNGSPTAINADAAKSPRPA